MAWTISTGTSSPRSFAFTMAGPWGWKPSPPRLNEEVDTLVDMVEPYLLQQGFVSRTKSGRKANEPAYGS